MATTDKRSSTQLRRDRIAALLMLLLFAALVALMILFGGGNADPGMDYWLMP